MWKGWRVAAMVCLSSASLAGKLPTEPIAIGNVPQFFVDDYIVDNRWAIKYGNASKEIVSRVQHAPRKYEQNPVIAPYLDFGQTDPSKPRASSIYITVIRDKDSGLFRMWYQLSRNPTGIHIKGTPAFPERAIAYAESRDGLTWVLPDVDPSQGDPAAPDRNIVWRGKG